MLCRGRAAIAVTGRASRSASLPPAIVVRPRPRKSGIRSVQNESFLVWDDRAQKHQLTLFCSEALGWTTAEVEEGLAELAALLPNFEDCLETVGTDELLGLLTQRDVAARVLLALRAELPSADVAEIIRKYPSVLTTHTPESVRERISLLRLRLPLPADLNDLLHYLPRFLDSDIDVNLLATYTDLTLFIRDVPELAPQLLRHPERRLMSELLRRYILGMQAGTSEATREALLKLAKRKGFA